MNDKNIIYYLNLALSEAAKAKNLGEVPVGAVVVNYDKTIISKAHNLTETETNPMAHAEIIAIQNASKQNKDWRLDSFILITTVEPCAMCLAAAKEARINRIYFGCEGNRVNKKDSIMLTNLNNLECKRIIKQFFKNLR